MMNSYMSKSSKKVMSQSTFRCHKGELCLFGNFLFAAVVLVFTDEGAALDFKGLLLSESTTFKALSISFNLDIPFVLRVS